MTETDSPSRPTAVPVDHAFVCDNCGHQWYYTRSYCPDCQEDEISTYELTEGELVAWTEIAVTPPDVRSPSRIGLARFGDVQLIAQLNDDDVSTGDRVKFTGEYRLREDDDAVEPRLTSLP